MKKNKSYTLYVDGASRGNPGPASIGVVLFQGEDEVFTISKSIGFATNNQAEYTALLEGLRRAHQEGISQISVRADSELMVRQINGEYRVKHEGLKGLWKEAQTLRSQFSEFDIVHVPRAQNARADELANQALDQ